MELYRRIAVITAAVFIVCLNTGAGESATFSGTVKIEPPYPQAKMIKVRKKVEDSCADEQISKSLLVSAAGGVSNAVVWLKGDFPSSVPEGPGGKLEKILDQKNCNFEPHVVLVPPGAQLQIWNSDPLAHDVRAFDEATMRFRLDMDEKSEPVTRTFDKPGIYTIRCGLHPWMHAFAVQAAHDHYAVTGPDGIFTLENVPEGNYELHIWHESLGEADVPVVIGGTRSDFTHTFRKAAGNPS